jgi:hypothetical protein|tara:strand:+ start:4367 stop:5128 length:762 start_codon:yes stop_codon:yes gene_type:complete
MHWYDRQGEPRHFIEGKNGKTRATTLRDARKYGWMPSVTSVLDILAKPGLDTWKTNKAIEAAALVPRGDLSIDIWKSKVLQESKRETVEASERGSRIHNMLENCFKNELSPTGADSNIFNAVDALLKINCGEQQWRSEETVCNIKDGYGGMIDLVSDEWVIDFKTKEFSTGSKQLAYESMAYQLIAYERALPAPAKRIANVFISASNPGTVVFHEWDSKDFDRYWTIFSSALEVWKSVKKYWPEKHGESNEGN